MTWLRSLLTLAFGCRHSRTYRERRELYGFDVMFLICDRCDHAVPAILRTPDEYRRGRSLQIPAPRAKVVQKPTAAERAHVMDDLTRPWIDIERPWRDIQRPWTEIERDQKLSVKAQAAINGREK